MATEPAETSRRPAGSQTDAANCRCAHCGLPVPAGLVDAAASNQFCCQGCRTVYELIHGCGLDRYYSLRDAPPGASPTRATGRSYESFDFNEFIERHCRAEVGGLMSAEFYLEGIHCAACIWLVEKLPRVVDGVVESRLDFRRSLVRVVWDPRRVALSRVAATLDHLGYPPHPTRDAKARELCRAQDRRFLVRIGVAGAAAGNVMTLALALYSGTFSGIEGPHAALFRWFSMALGVLSLAWPGNVFFRGAWAAVRTRTAHLDVPIALGLLVGGVAGVVNTVLGRGEIYFDSLTMLVFLLLIGRWLQFRQQRWTADAVGLLYSLTPNSARRVETDGVREVPVESLARADLVEVRAGETIAVDGEVEAGESAVDVSWLTGEPRPVSVRSGAEVLAGTVNLAAPIRVRVSAAGVETRAARLMQLVEEGTRNRAPLVQFADRVAGRFTWVVVSVAIATFVAWLRIDASRAPDAAAAILIVCCPCALGLAVPLAFSAAMGRAARRGILIKNGGALEVLARGGRLFVDKTGTVTEGRVSLVWWWGDASVQPLVGALERHSSHPVALALVAGLEGSPDESASVVLRESMRDGLVGTADDRTLLVGSQSFIRSRAAEISEAMAAAVRESLAAGLTPVLVAIDSRVVAIAGLGDRVREDSAAAVQAFRQLGWDVSLLSGDHPDVVVDVGGRLGLSPAAQQGGATPEHKLAEVRRAAESGAVVMVGDGVNDAAALSEATVGIAVHGGAEASLAAADVYLARPGLAPIVDLLHMARRTVRSIHLSFAASLVYNVTAVALAATGVITPLIAAVLMPLSSFTVAAIVLGRRTAGATSCR